MKELIWDIFYVFSILLTLWMVPIAIGMFLVLITYAFSTLAKGMEKLTEWYLVIPRKQWELILKDNRSKKSQGRSRNPGREKRHVSYEDPE